MNMDPAGSVKQKIDLVWPKLRLYSGTEIITRVSFKERILKVLYTKGCRTCSLNLVCTPKINSGRQQSRLVVFPKKIVETAQTRLRHASKIPEVCTLA